jgi:hypothetical protein
MSSVSTNGSPIVAGGQRHLAREELKGQAL